MGLVTDFEETLPGNVGFRSTAPEEFEDAIDGLVGSPAVGAPLGFDEVSLEVTDVNLDPSPDELMAAETGVTPAGLGIADYGSVTLRSSGLVEFVSLYPSHHVAVLRAGDVVPDMHAAFHRLGEEFHGGLDTQVLATGPSATADMGTLVHGVHGPEEVDVVVVEEIQ